MENIDLNNTEINKRTNDKISNELKAIIVDQMDNGLENKYGVKAGTTRHIYSTIDYKGKGTQISSR